MFGSRTIKACRAWLGLCDSGITLKDSTLEDAVDSFRKLVEVAEGYEKLCNSQESLIKTLEEKVKFADAAVSSLTKMVQDGDKTICHKDNKIAEKNEIISNLYEVIDQKNKDIDWYREKLKCDYNEIEEKDTIIDNLRTDIASMEDEIFRLRELNNNQAILIANKRTKEE